MYNPLHPTDLDYYVKTNKTGLIYSILHSQSYGVAVQGCGILTPYRMHNILTATTPIISDTPKPGDTSITYSQNIKYPSQNPKIWWYPNNPQTLWYSQ